MVSAQERTFTARVNRRARQAERDNTPQIILTIQTEDDETGEVLFSEAYTFTKPDDERLFLMATAFGAAADRANAASEVDATLRAMMLHKQKLPNGKDGKSEYLALRERIDGPDDKKVPLEDVMEILGVLTEEFADFPTQPSSGSSAGSPGIGGNSTGRVPGEAVASTPSHFPSIGS